VLSGELEDQPKWQPLPAYDLGVEANAGLDLRSFLGAAEEASPIDAVDVLAAELVIVVGARHLSLLIANFSGTGLIRLSHVVGTRESAGRNERADDVLLPGTLYERVLWSQAAEVTTDAEGWLAVLPITERGDAIGLLEVSLDEAPDAALVDFLLSAAHSLAYLLIAARRHTDLFEWAQRDIPFSVAAEIQRRLLPSAYTAEAGPLTLAGWLEPSHDAGGDSFDYSLDREFLYASLTDAMGHSTEAALLATLTVATLRNQRRALASPAQQAEAAHASLKANARQDQFVTGLLLRIRLSDGQTEIVNAGHPLPYLLRNGQATRLELTAHPPLGVAVAPYTADVITLEAGDRLLLVTDGYLERGAANVDIEGILASNPERHPRQIVQELARNVLAATGSQLRDDATTLCLDWYGPGGRREATGGASSARATMPLAGPATDGR
jgi:serine phosphatase RsbU (regulator of sigma subunit)